VNCEELKKRIDERGLKIRYIAEKLGISHEAMYNKVKGKTEFKVSEVAALAKVLNLSDKEIRSIFFAR
jgi:predicted transcriptional regulator